MLTRRGLSRGSYVVVGCSLMLVGGGCGDRSGRDAEVIADVTAAPDVAVEVQDASGLETEVANPPPAGVSNTPLPIVVDGFTREYAAYVPPAVLHNAVPVPLVLAMHGSKGNGEAFFESTGWRAQADAHRFIALFPTGRKYFAYTEAGDGGEPACVESTKWNTGALEVAFCRSGQVAADDVGFIRQLVAAWVDTGLVDPTRVYASGFSAGGAFTARLASEASDVVAAVSIVGGVPSTPPTPGRSAIPVLYFLGTRDEHALERTTGVTEFPFGSEVFADAYIASVRDAYLELAQLDVTVRQSTGATAISFCYDRPLPGAPGNVFDFWLMQGMHHLYPPGERGYPVDAAHMSWQFFDHTQPGQREVYCSAQRPIP